MPIFSEGVKVTVTHFSNIFNARSYKNCIYFFLAHADIYFYNFFIFILLKIHIGYIKSQEVSKSHETFIWRPNTKKVVIG